MEFLVWYFDCKMCCKSNVNIMQQLFASGRFYYGVKQLSASFQCAISDTQLAFFSITVGSFSFFSRYPLCSATSFSLWHTCTSSNNKHRNISVLTYLISRYNFPHLLQLNYLRENRQSVGFFGAWPISAARHPASAASFASCRGGSIDGDGSQTNDRSDSNL